MMRIAILALQGAFVEHQQMLESLGADTFLVRNLSDWLQAKDALIIPGGESTTMLKLVKSLNLYEPIRGEIQNGLPVFGTCAGLIMLDAEHLNTMDIKVKRNAYGRQLGSFNIKAPFADFTSVDMTFIRAPYIEEVGNDVDILATVDGHIVAARQGRQLVTAFHPELDSDTSVHQYFLSVIAGLI